MNKLTLRIWRPSEYLYARLGCEIRFRFPVLKLLDWRERTEELANSTNPIAVIVLAHLESLATNHRPMERYQAKRQLIRRLFERGWDNQQIRELFRLVDWLLDLPAELQQQFRDDIHKFVGEFHPSSGYLILFVVPAFFSFRSRLNQELSS